MKSPHYFCQKENMDNDGLYGKDFGISNASLASMNREDLSDRGVLTPWNRNSAGSREIESPNSGTDSGFLSFENRLKQQRSEADLMGIDCRCDLGSSSKTNSSSNRSRPRTSQGVESGLKPRTVTSDENLGPVNRSKLEISGRPLCRVASEGNLKELEHEHDFGSTVERRSVSPKARTFFSAEMESESSRMKRYRRISEIILDNNETQTHQSPNYGLHCSPNENPSSNKSKPWYPPRSDYLLHRHQCSCDKHRSQIREGCSSHNLEEKYIRQTLSNESERKVVSSSRKGNSGFPVICKVIAFLVFSVMVFLSVSMKEGLFLRPNFGAHNSTLGINQTDLFLNPVDLESNHSEGVDFERQIEPYEGRGNSFRGELEEKTKSLASKEAVQIEEVEMLGELKCTEISAEENTSNEEDIKSLASSGTAVIEEMVEEPNFTYIPAEENIHNEEFQFKTQNEFNSENLEQCGMLDVAVEGLEEGLMPTSVKKIGYVALVEANTDNRVEERKLEMRMRFCLAFLSVVLCISLVSCIVRREQFSEMLERYSSSSKGEKSSKKKQKQRDSSVPLEGSYGSIVTLEKIPIKKRGGDSDVLLTPVRRSSRIRSYLTS